MNRKLRFVVDTNILVSQSLRPHSVPTQAFRKALSCGVLLASEETLEELTDVLSRKKFDPYLTFQERQDFLRHLSYVVEIVPHIRALKVCRDPKDDKFLSLALQGQADMILTGDRDLLILDPFQDIRIYECHYFLNYVNL